jgi:pyruvate dehydrogenase E2 component (dihydrolipoamide acetyltransferase)
VARAVATSWTEKPHTYFTVAVEMTAAQALRERGKAEGNPVSYDALLLAALARALPEFPALRSVWREGRVVALEGIHLAVALSRGEELFLPVIRDADRLSPAQMQAELDELVAEIQAGALHASRLTGACLALSNLGMYPIESFDPIIFPEHSSILAVGAVQPTPVAVEGRVEIRPIMRMTLAADHRVINGRTAAAFLAAVKGRLESGDLE